ncbi:hypothetical protein SAP269_06880 [Spiroplasma ixodetis]|uniref:Uncharacterized protein n=1 Tax=Spiroplasma ixodetis TaxID=2141 RepID=A0ABM8JLD6_9MOLU
MHKIEIITKNKVKYKIRTMCRWGFLKICASFYKVTSLGIKVMFSNLCNLQK